MKGALRRDLSAPRARGTRYGGPGGARAGRAGRRKIAVLEAACRVIADRGADATRFADVAAESGVPVSTLQYYFGSREDLLVAAFRHASSAEIAALEAEVAGLDDPWDQLEKILTTSLTGYAPDAPGGGRLWIESWHFGLRDQEMRADALRDNTGLAAAGGERGPARYRARESSAAGTTRTRSRCSPWPPPTGWASRCRSATRRSPPAAPCTTCWPRCASCCGYNGPDRATWFMIFTSRTAYHSLQVT
jgi:AcrR family transcriptional regulator